MQAGNNAGVPATASIAADREYQELAAAVVACVRRNGSVSAVTANVRALTEHIDVKLGEARQEGRRDKHETLVAMLKENCALELQVATMQAAMVVPDAQIVFAARPASAYTRNTLGNVLWVQEQRIQTLVARRHPAAHAKWQVLGADGQWHDEASPVTTHWQEQAAPQRSKTA